MRTEDKSTSLGNYTTKVRLFFDMEEENSSEQKPENLYKSSERVITG